MKSIAKEERTNEQKSNLTKTKYDEVKPVEKNNDTVEILQGLHDEIISKDIRTLKSKEEAHIQLCQRKTSVPSQRKSSQGQNIKAAVTPEKKQEKKQTVLSRKTILKSLQLSKLVIYWVYGSVICVLLCLWRRNN